MAMMLVRRSHDHQLGRRTHHRARQPLQGGGVGLCVPFSGYSFFPAFGDSNQGCRAFASPISVSVVPGGRGGPDRPYLTQMIEALGGSKHFVTIGACEHGFRVEDAPEVFGWTFAFFKAHLSRKQTDRTAFNSIDNIPGGSDDRVKIRKTLAWGSRDELEVVEFYSPGSRKILHDGPSR